MSRRRSADHWFALALIFLIMTTVQNDLKLEYLDLYLIHFPISLAVRSIVIFHNLMQRSVCAVRDQIPARMVPRPLCGTAECEPRVLHMSQPNPSMKLDPVPYAATYAALEGRHSRMLAQFFTAHSFFAHSLFAQLWSTPS